MHDHEIILVLDIYLSGIRVLLRPGALGSAAQRDGADRGTRVRRQGGTEAVLGTGGRVMEQLVMMIVTEVARMAADYAALLAAARIGG